MAEEDGMLHSPGYRTASVNPTWTPIQPMMDRSRLAYAVRHNRIMMQGESGASGYLLVQQCSSVPTMIIIGGLMRNLALFMIFVNKKAESPS